jgi:MFS family permease
MPRMDRDRLVRRNAIRLAVAQGFVQMSFPVLLVIGGPAASHLAGRRGASGLLWAIYFLAAAGGAFVIGRWMDRAGRRPGLLLSYALVAVAGIGCALSIRSGTFAGLVASTVVFGVAVGGANLSRAAVADMYPPERRGQAVGLLLAAGTVGAVGSPFLAAFAATIAKGRGIDPDVLPWAIVPAAAALAFAAVLTVRPDPRDLAATGGDHPGEGEPRRGPRELLGIPAFRVAVLAAVAGQAAMVGVMGVTPEAMAELHHSTVAISFVISLHISGMFALGPLIGRWTDRVGHRIGLLAGCGVSIAGALVASTEVGAIVIGAGLFMIGIGWSATFLGATAVISDVTSATERAGALGFTDLAISTTSAAAGLGGGLILSVAGYRIVGVALAGVVGVVLLTVLRLRSERPAPAASAS